MKMLTTFVLVCAGMALTNAAAVPEPDQTGEVEVHIQRDADVGVVCSGGCPLGWTQYKNRCFAFHTGAKPWADAERHCQALGANLASLHSSAEDQFVKDYVWRIAKKPQTVWIGGKDSLKPHWVWSDGAFFAYTRWCYGRPSNYSNHQYCIQVNYDVKGCWSDAFCHLSLPFVCARSL